jgi:hypothetical protein
VIEVDFVIPPSEYVIVIVLLPAVEVLIGDIVHWPGDITLLDPSLYTAFIL